MITQALLKRIQKKNPKYTTEQIRLVIAEHLGMLNQKTSQCQTLNITIPKLGRIHTHGNAKNKNKINCNATQQKYQAIKYAYTDTQLLF